VFLSWSGHAAGEFARRFAKWLNLTGAPVDSFLSQEISKGSRWSDAVMGRLASCDFGVLVVTSENLHSEWMHFEAGALSQAVARTGSAAAVAPLLLDVEPYELPETLAQFQATRCEQEDVVGLIQALRSVREKPGPSLEVTREQVDTHWPKFEAARAAALELIPSKSDPKPIPLSLTEELLFEIRTEVGNLRQLNEYLVRRLGSTEAISLRSSAPIRGAQPESTLDDDLGPVSVYQFSSESDATGFSEWLVENYPSIETQESHDALTVSLLAYDEVEQYDRLRIRDAAIRDFGGERLD
jgi:hypothetical protein